MSYYLDYILASTANTNAGGAGPAKASTTKVSFSIGDSTGSTGSYNPQTDYSGGGLTNSTGISVNPIAGAGQEPANNYWNVDNYPGGINLNPYWPSAETTKTQTTQDTTTTDNSAYNMAYLQYLKDQAAAGNQQAAAELAFKQQQLNTTNAYNTSSLAQNQSQFESSQAQQQSQFDATFGQNAYEFAKTFGLNQQQQDWLQNYQQQQLNQSANQQVMDQNNYLANLAANPINWLQYNQASQTPTVAQPWMSALGGKQTGSVISGQQYIPQGDASGLSSALSPQATPVSASNVVGQPNAMGLSNLLTPSMQTYSTMTPSERAQYAGYQTALTGASTADTQFKLWNQAAPSGNAGLSYSR
jgi:hypothetical protein